MDVATSESPARSIPVGRTVLWLAGAAAAAWVLVAVLFVPWMIRTAYSGQNLPAFNALIEGRTVYPVGFYLGMWWTFAVRATTAVLAGLAVLLVARQPWFFDRFVGPATPGTLGAIRMLTCAVLLVTTSWEDLGSVALLPVALRRPAGLIDLLLSLPFGQILASAGFLRALQVATEGLLFLGMIGWKTRVVIPLAAAAHFLALGMLVEYSFFWHQGLVPLYLMVLLSFLPCGDGWSLDRLLKVYRGQPASSQRAAIYGWGRYLCWVAIVLPYVESGLSKVRIGGTAWWSAVNMRNMLFTDTLSPREYDWDVALRLLPAPDALFVFLGVATIVLEVGYLLVLFSRRARSVFPLVIAGMHVGIFALQRILFLDLIALQLVFGDYAGLRRRMRTWIAGEAGSMVVWFDGACGRCDRTVRLLNAFDIFGVLTFRDFRSEGTPNHGSKLPARPALTALERSMHVTWRGRVTSGFRAYRTIALALPAFWPVVPFAWLPGVAAVGERVYARYAAHRPVACDRRAGAVAAFAPAAERGAALRTRCAACLGIVAAVSCACWLMRIEFYPLTAWHLYSNADLSGRITYYRVAGRDAGGAPMRARLEEGIGAFALDARYMGAVVGCFGSAEEQATCRAYLVANGHAANQARRGGSALAQYEIQKWAWDFEADPWSPNHGELIDRVLIDVGAPAARSLQASSR